MNSMADKTVRWPLAVAVFLVLGFILSNFHLMGSARDIEKLYSTIAQEPAVFKSDAFALSSLNDVIMWINSHVSDETRLCLYYLFFGGALILLWLIANKISGSPWGGAIVIALQTYSTFNYVSLNQVFLSFDFAGQLLSGLFILLSFLFFLEKRFYGSSFFAACAFYLHPGVCLWYLIALFSHIPFAVAARLKKGRTKAEVLSYLKEMVFYVGLFAILVAPRLYQILGGHGKPSLIDPQVRYNFLKYLWYSQTSLWLCIKFGSWLTQISFISNGILFFLIHHYFLKQDKKSETLQAVLWMYTGSFIFLILNELMIHVFDFHLSVVYGLSRSSAFNFLFMTILVGAMVVGLYRQRRFMEFFLWVCFIFNYSVLHYKNLSPLLQIFLLILIVCVRLIPWTRRQEQAVADGVFRNGKVVIVLSLLVALGLTVMRVQKHIKSNPSAFDGPYAQAIRFVNDRNTSRGMVMYPFDKPEEFFYFTKNPGFFTSYYTVLFIDTYNYDRDAQWKAYQKFKSLENEFGIDTLANAKRDPATYKEPWGDAWEHKVDRDFVERWSRQEPIRYVIREKALPDLPYRIVFQNDDYRVYER